MSWNLPDSFSLKEIFPNLTRDETTFVTKGLKTVGFIPLENKRFVAKDLYPSNVWENTAAPFACAFLGGYREVRRKHPDSRGRIELLKELLDEHVYAMNKWGEPYIDSRLLDLAESIGLIKKV